MLIERKNLKADNIILFTICFFLYSGYYLGLEVIISLGLIEYSRFYSVPLRLILSVFMLIYIIKKINIKFSNLTLITFILMIGFFIQYIMMLCLNINSQIYMLDKIEYIFYFLSYSVFVFLYFFVTDFNKKVVIIAFIYSGFFLSLMTSYLYWDVFLGGVGRISRLVYQGNNDFISPLALSYASVINFLMGWLYFKEYQEKRFYLNIIVLVMILLSIPMFILGASRGSFVSGFLIVVYIFSFSNIRTKILSLFIIPIFVYALYYVTIITGSNAFERFLGIKDAVDHNDSSAARLDMWSTGINYFYSSPLYGGYLEVGGIYPHDIFVEILMNTGLFGFFCLFIPVLILFIFGVRYTIVEKTFFIPLIFIMGFSMHLFSGSIYVAPILFASLGLLLNRLNTKLIL